MSNPQIHQLIDSKKCILWLDPNSTMAEIQRFVGIVGVFHAKGGSDPLRFELTPKKGIKARLLHQCNVTAVRGLPHPRFSHPTTGKRILRLSEAISISKVLSGIPLGERLTTKVRIPNLPTKG